MSDPEADGWNYRIRPANGTDSRKLVTLEEGGMVWVGIRAYHHAKGIWLNNGEPEQATVKAWRDLPEPCSGFWIRGILHFHSLPAGKETT